MSKYAASLFTKEQEIESGDLSVALTRKSIEISKFPFDIDYSFGGKNSGEFTNDPPTITINLAASCKWKLGRDKYGDEAKLCYDIDFRTVGIIFFHEFVHYIQYIRRTEANGHYKLPLDWANPKKYYKRGWERQAYAIQYLEQLKQELNYKKPEEILSSLRKLGLTHHNVLNTLKKTDYKSWKAIMKNAIVTAMADVKEGKPLPWQYH